MLISCYHAEEIWKKSLFKTLRYRMMLNDDGLLKYSYFILINIFSTDVCLIE